MKIQDGFIVGIFSYCDRWCEQCSLTNRCRMFASLADIDFDEADGTPREPRMLRERRRLATQLIELHVMAEEFGRAGLPDPRERIGNLPTDLEPNTGPDADVLTHGSLLRKKLHQLGLSANPTVRLASETIRYFSLFVPMKMMQALSQVARSGPGDQQSDANGAGKVAMLALERMDRAWHVLIETHHVSASVAAPFLEEVARMQRNLNRALPNAGAFIRPGFDELEEVKMLDAAKC